MKILGILLSALYLLASQSLAVETKKEAEIVNIGPNFFVLKGELWKKADKGQSALKLAPAISGFKNFEVSPDGKYLVYQKKNASLEILETATGKSKKLIEGGSLAIDKWASNSVLSYYEGGDGDVDRIVYGVISDKTFNCLMEVPAEYGHNCENVDRPVKVATLQSVRVTAVRLNYFELNGSLGIEGDGVYLPETPTAQRVKVEISGDKKTLSSCHDAAGTQVGGFSAVDISGKGFAVDEGEPDSKTIIFDFDSISKCELVRVGPPSIPTDHDLPLTAQEPFKISDEKISPALSSVSFSFPYPLVWEDANNEPNFGATAKFSLKGVALGDYLIEKDTLSALWNGFNNQNYSVGQKVYSLIIHVKMNIMKGGSPPHLIRIVNKEGDKFAPPHRDFLYPNHLPMNDFVQSDTTIEDAILFFPVDRNQSEFVINTGGISNYTFKITVKDKHLSVSKMVAASK